MVHLSGNYVPRVDQLDALDLDQEVTRIVKDQFLNIFKFSGATFLSKWEPELDLLLKLLVWKFSVIKNRATFGHQLLGLKLAGEFSNRKAWLFALITFGAKYLQSRSIEIATLPSSRTSKDLVHKIFKYMDVGFNVCKLINIYIFLRKGIYPTLTYRILDFKIAPVDPCRTRKIGYTYMTRELLWHGFIELLGNTTPLINYNYLKRKIEGLLFTKEPMKSINATLNKDSVCSICREQPVLPQKIGCSHIFCYYCITAQLMADPQFECNVCGFSAQDSVQPVKM